MQPKARWHAQSFGGSIIFYDFPNPKRVNKALNEMIWIERKETKMDALLDPEILLCHLSILG